MRAVPRPHPRTNSLLDQVTYCQRHRQSAGSEATRLLCMGRHVPYVLQAQISVRRPWASELTQSHTSHISFLCPWRADKRQMQADISPVTRTHGIYRHLHSSLPSDQHSHPRPCPEKALRVVALWDCHALCRQEAGGVDHIQGKDKTHLRAICWPTEKKCRASGSVPAPLGPLSLPQLRFSCHLALCH